MTAHMTAHPYYDIINLVGDCVERLAFQIRPAALLSPTNPVILSYESIRLFRLILGKSIQIFPSHFLLHAPQSVFEEDLLKDSSRQQSKATNRGARISK